MKTSIRQTKSEQKTGSADSENGKAVLQPGDFLEQIKMTDGHAKRNMLARREECISMMQTPNKKANTGVSSKTPQEGSNIKTKAQMLDKQSTSISRISENYEKTSNLKQQLLEAKATRAKIENLKEALALGLISQEDFNKRATSLLL